MMEHKVEYGFFALARAKGGTFHKPDGSTEPFDSHDEAVRAHNAWIVDEALPKAVAAARQAREAFCESCTTNVRRVKQQGLLNPDRFVTDIHDPDGKVIAQDVPDDELADRIANVARTRYPDPTRENLPNGERGHIADRVVWQASLFIDGERKDLPAFDRWTYGLPIEDVLGVLNELAAEGWSVVQTSEDRGIYAGVTNTTDSAVTKARYLLVRER
jgi:hypothetical protein